jgi:hypothetical protein
MLLLPFGGGWVGVPMIPAYNFHLQKEQPDLHQQIGLLFLWCWFIR